MRNYRAFFSLVLTCTFLGVFSCSFAAENANILKELGLKKGHTYFASRKQLINQGWRIDMAYAEEVNETAPHSPYGFKEVVCGNGKDAVCSARFLRNGREIMLLLKPKEHLITDSAWDDKP